jgi:hypothetical protein
MTTATIEMTVSAINSEVSNQAIALKQNEVTALTETQLALVGGGLLVNTF